MLRYVVLSRTREISFLNRLAKVMKRKKRHSGSLPQNNGRFALYHFLIENGISQSVQRSYMNDGASEQETIRYSALDLHCHTHPLLTEASNRQLASISFLTRFNDFPRKGLGIMFASFRFIGFHPWI